MYFLWNYFCVRMGFTLNVLWKTSSISEDSDTDSENHSVVIRKIGSHPVKTTVSKYKTLMGI